MTIPEERKPNQDPIKVDSYCPVCNERVDEFDPDSATVRPCGHTVHQTMRYTVRFHNVDDDLG